MTLARLYTIVKSRAEENPRGSYVASLFSSGRDRIIQKVGEEASEVLIAAKNPDRNRQIEEVCDLLFHVLVLLVSLDIPLSRIWKELERRNNT
jgi:phosphoribosyl-ATP pyrophosphohydrolase